MNTQHYPDVLGLVANERLTVDDVVQCALGIFPTTTAVGQPIELLLLLQNLIDQVLPLQLAIKTPARDTQGNLVNIFTPRPRITASLPAGETGLFHIPLTPQLPTPPGKNYPVQVQIAVQKPGRFKPVRLVTGGPPPNMLSLSPVRIAVLRDIKFTAQASEANQIGVTFDVLPGRFPPRTDEPASRYEALWTAHEMEREKEKMQAVAGEALRFANGLNRRYVFTPLLNRTRDAFGDAGMTLHPGEALFIAKILTYVMEDGLELEKGFSLAGGYWFQRLCALMAQDPTVIQDINHLVDLLYPAVVQDAARLGFRMVAQFSDADFGTEPEQDLYITKLVAALEGRLPLGLEHIYIPLALAGTIQAAHVVLSDESPWRSLDVIKDAREARIALVEDESREIFDLLNQLIERAKRVLREMRIPRD